MKRLLLVTVVIGLAACSSSSAGPSGQATRSTALPATELAVSASEFTYDITDIAVPADETFTIDFTNAGTIPHEWAVLKEGVRIDTHEQFREDMVEFEIEALDEGTSTTKSFKLPAGEYQFICALEGHFAAGMHGTLQVVA
jgi:uncharacterized cupredoxin-like copper-binding protein